MQLTVFSGEWCQRSVIERFHLELYVGHIHEEWSRRSGAPIYLYYFSLIIIISIPTNSPQKNKTKNHWQKNYEFS